MQFNISHLAEAYRLTTSERERTASPVLQRLRAGRPTTGDLTAVSPFLARCRKSAAAPTHDESILP